jgi:hypothetical protein
MRCASHFAGFDLAVLLDHERPAYWLPCAAIYPIGWCTTMRRLWSRDEVVDYWTLGPKELELFANKSGATRLGFAVLLKAFALEGRFRRQKHDVPGVVIVHVATQVNVAAELYPRHEWSGRTIEYHRAQIREFLGFREAPGAAVTRILTSFARLPRHCAVHNAVYEIYLHRPCTSSSGH